LRGSHQARTVEGGGVLTGHARHRRPRALLVDDDPFVLAILAALLDECGIDSVRADDAHSGLEKLSEELLSLDLLVTDLVMPDLGGDALVMAVREIAGQRDLPIVVASSFLDEARTEALRVVGADAVVNKGSGLAPVVAAARALLAARGILDGARVSAEPERPALRAAEPEGQAPVPLGRIGLKRAL
jgi:CheY-like chemotaxis protein